MMISKIELMKELRESAGRTYELKLSGMAFLDSSFYKIVSGTIKDAKIGESRRLIIETERGAEEEFSLAEIKRIKKDDNIYLITYRDNSQTKIILRS